MKKTCCIFFYEGYLEVAPTVVGLAQALSKEGYSVFIYATENEFPKLKISNNQITVHYFAKGQDLLIVKSLYDFINKLKFGNLVSVIEVLLFVLQSIIFTIKERRTISPKNSIGIGVDTNGSILALILSFVFKQKYSHLSLELPFLRISKLYSIIQHCESLAYQKSVCIIVQDEDRFQSLCSYYNYQHSNVFYLPNSPSADDILNEGANDSSNYFREKFSLDEDEYPYLIVQAGQICDFSFSKELASAFNSIHNGCALIFHERKEVDLQTPYIQSLIKINSSNLVLSLQPLPFEQIDRVYTSTTIGLAFYRDVDNNYAQIAKASGKLSYYLKHGKPVLVNNLESLSKLVQKYEIGVVIKDPSNPVEIEAGIRLILENYAAYSQNAKVCFMQEFDFNSQCQPLLCFLDALW